MRIWWWIRLLAVTAVLAVTGWQGITEGLNATRAGVSTGQHVAIATQLAYGLFGALATIALLARSRYSSPLTVIWGLALCATAGLAPIVWGGSSLLTGAIAAAVALLVAALVTWGALADARARESVGRAG